MQNMALHSVRHAWKTLAAWMDLKTNWKGGRRPFGRKFTWPLLVFGEIVALLLIYMYSQSLPTDINDASEACLEGGTDHSYHIQGIVTNVKESNHPAPFYEVRDLTGVIKVYVDSGRQAKAGLPRPGERVNVDVQCQRPGLVWEMVRSKAL